MALDGGTGGRGLWLERLDVENEFYEGACDEGRRKVGGKIVVEEQLAAHDVEGDVVGGPGQEEKTCGVVETGASTIVKSIHSTSQGQLIGTDNASKYCK